MVNLTRRQKKLLRLMLSEKGFKTIKSYASMMQVSERTMYSDLEIIRQFLEENNAKLQKKPGTGVKVQMKQEVKDRMLNAMDMFNDKMIPLSTNERKIDILKQLLLSEKTTSLQKLSETYLVSKSSLVNDLDEIEVWVQPYHIKLIRDRRGTQIIGDEKNKRKAIAEIIIRNIHYDFSDEEKFPQSRVELGIFKRLASIFGTSDLMIVEEIISEAEKQLNYYIIEPYYTNLITHVLISISRITSGYKIDNISNNERHGDRDKTYFVTCFIAGQITENFGIDIPEKEVIYLHQYILGSGKSKDMTHADLSELIHGIDEDTRSVVTEMITLSSRIVHMDFSADKELYLGLLMHVKPMLNRLYYSIHIKNQLLSDIKEQYSGTFAMTLLASSAIENQLDLRVNEDEIGYLTTYFQAAIERQMTVKNVIVVCPDGIGTSELIANRIKRYLPQFNVKATMPLTELNKIDRSDEHIDFIISTVPIPFDSLPVVVVSPLVNEIDLKNISSFTTNLSVSHLIKENTSYYELLRFLESDLIFCDVDFQDKKTVIHFMCRQLANKGYVSRNYGDSVIEREQTTPTSIGKCVAMPHGDSRHVQETKVSIAILKHAIDWGHGVKVKMIFMIAVKMDETISKKIIRDFYRLFESENTLNKVISSNTPEELLHVLKGSSRYLESVNG
ncbi:BglG family transcription antiterminator [Oceanobacillus timonensis]|uniref:BglG family transcription antiterminator n=1 Tax=Oceanobacillus timonensis TaxID=1926285 RepID=UPI0015C48767|nr:PTS sugar transporter subunit IIA [Oceanobacillus timonensis]